MGELRAAGGALMSVVDGIDPASQAPPARGVASWSWTPPGSATGSRIHRKLIRADDGPPRVGYRMDQQIHMRGVSLDVHWTLVECEPERAGRVGGTGPGPLTRTHRIRAARRGRRRNAALTTATSFTPPLGPVGADRQPRPRRRHARARGHRTLESSRDLMRGKTTDTVSVRVKFHSDVTSHHITH